MLKVITTGVRELKQALLCGPDEDAEVDSLEQKGAAYPIVTKLEQEGQIQNM